MDFGLGLILSFTDNATAGINNAVNSLHQLTETANGAMSSMNQMASLSALSVVSGQLGNSFASAGGKILGMFSNLLGNVQRTGSEFESFRVTLNAVYGDAEKAEEAIGKLLDFSIKSPFEVEGVKNMLVLLKSQGIDAFEDMQGAITKTHQESLAWIADLMAFKPDESTLRWKRALTNYIGSGQSLMLRNILDMGKIEQILGHEISSTVEERMNDIVEIVEKKGLTGLAEKLSFTWTGVASNVADAWTKLYKSIADNEVFENLKRSFMSLSGAILSMSNEDLEAFGKTMADGLNLIIEPITMVTDKVNSLFQSLVNIAKTNPGLVKMGMVVAALSGVVLVSIGIFLKATSALSGLSLMYLAFGNQFNSLGALFKSGATKILGALLPLTLAIGVLYMVWKNDLGGIATTVKTFVGNVSNSFNVAYDTVNGSLSRMYEIFRTFNTKENFFDGLTVAIMRLMVLGRALFEGWNDFEISEDTFNKMEALGIKPLVEALFDLKYRLDQFVQGFKEGFGSVLQTVTDFFTGLASAVEGTVFYDALNSITGFFQNLSNNDPEAWKDLGSFIGELAAKAALFGVAFKLIKTVLTPVIGLVLKAVGVFKTLFSLFSSAGNFIGTVIRSFREVFTLLRGGAIAPVTKLGQLFVKLSGFLHKVGVVATQIAPKIIGAFIKVGSTVGSILTKIAAHLGGISIGATAAVIIAVIGSVVAFAVTAKDKFVALFSGLWEHIKTILGSIAERFNMVVSTVKGLCAPIIPLITGAIDNIKAAIGRLTSSGTLRTVLSAVVRVLSFIGELIVGTVVPALRLIASVIGGVVKAAIDVLGGAIAGIFTAIGGVIAGVINVISGFINIVIGIINTVGGLFKGIFTGDWSTFVGGLKSIGTGILEFFGGIVEAVGGVIGGIAEVVGGIVAGVFDLGVSIVQGLIDGIGSFIHNAVTAVVDLFTSIIDAIKNFLGIHSPSTVFAEIGGFLVQGLLQGIINLWSTIPNFFSSVFEGLKSMFTTAWNSIKSTVSSAMGNIRSIISNIWSNIVSSVRHFMASIVQEIIRKFHEAKTFVTNLASEALNWGADIVGNIAQGIKDKISDVTDAVTGVADKIKSFLHFSTPDEGPLTDFDSWMPDMMNQLAEGVSQHSAVVTEAFNAVANVMTTETHNMMESVTNTFQSGWKTVSLEIPTYWNNIGVTVITSANSVKTAFADSWSELPTIAATTWNAVAETVTLSIMAIAEKSTTLFNSLSGSSNTSMMSTATAISTVLISILSNTRNTLNNTDAMVSAFASKVKSTVTKLMGNTRTVIDTGWSNIESRFETAGNNIQSSVTTAFSGMNTTITSAMATAKNTISTALSDMQNQFASTVFRFNQNIALPHFDINGKLNVETGQVPTLDVSWYKNGGVFDEPTMIGVGEAGKEAVVPLESNTAWIKELAYQIGGYIPDEVVRPTPINTTNLSGSSYYGDTNSYMTNTSGGNTDSHDIQDSHDVTFEKGSITVQVMNASEEEAERFANLIMQKVKRKQEIEDMLHYKRR